MGCLWNWVSGWFNGWIVNRKLPLVQFKLYWQSSYFFSSLSTQNFLENLLIFSPLRLLSITRTLIKRPKLRFIFFNHLKCLSFYFIYFVSLPCGLSHFYRFITEKNFAFQCFVDLGGGLGWEEENAVFGWFSGWFCILQKVKASSVKKNREKRRIH